MTNVCLNLSLPHYKKILDVYGDIVGLEIISYMTSDKFIDWYGNLEFPNIINNVVTNINNEKLHVSDMLSFSKSLFENTELKTTTDTKINEKSVYDMIKDLKNKPINTLTESEKKLILGKTSISKFASMLKKQYISEPIFSTEDRLFEVFHKLETFADDKYKPLIKFIRENINNYNIKFDTIDTIDDYYNDLKLIGSEFYAYYDPVNNTIKMNKYLFEKDNKVFNYTNSEFNDYLLHEIIHAFTVYRFNNDDVFKNDIDDILNYIKENISQEEFNKYQDYLEDPEELLSSSFHDVNFQNVLSKIPSMKKNISVYQNFIDTIKAYINIDSPNIIDDIFDKTLDTILQKKLQFDSISRDILDLKFEIIKKYKSTDNKHLQLIVDGLAHDWLNFKYDYPNFNDFKTKIFDKLDSCLL